MDERQQVILHKLKQVLPTAIYKDITQNVKFADAENWEMLASLTQPMTPENQQAIYQQAAKKIQKTTKMIQKNGSSLMRKIHAAPSKNKI